MSIGLCRLELGKFAWLGGRFSNRAEKGTAWYLRPRLIFLPAVVFAVVMAWSLVSGNSAGRAESDPAPPATATIQPAAAPAGPAAAPTDTSLNAAEPPAVSGLKISSQSWRRGGLGSNALFTFTVRNTNDYAVKDVEIHCAFIRKDGTHLTDRTRIIPDTIEMKTRKTFRRMHIGFVNVNASKAICSLVTASRS
jgi:hypothetical protein